MTGAVLPVALARWAPALAALQPGLALAIGPMVRALDELISRGDAVTARHGVVDGYGGLSRRGDPHRIVASEWALAAEAPLEFLRRATGGELLHLEHARVEERPRGRVAVLVDCGPDQLGAGRLVQLAALVVLLRRAAGRGSELRLGILGDDAGTWRRGGPGELLGGWLRARRPDLPRSADVAAWTGSLDRADELWLLTGPPLAAALPGRRRTVVAAESAWGPAGATAVRVVVDGHPAELALPRGAAAVRALRESGRRIQPEDSLDSVRLLAFPSSWPVLLGRGRRDDEIVRIAVPEPGVTPTRPRRHTFPGPVLTATVIGRRVVALVAERGHVVVRVQGKDLGHVHGMSVPAAALDLTRDELAELASGPLTPLVYDGGGLLARVGDRWWRLPDDYPPRPAGTVLTVLPRDQVDQPAVARTVGPGVVVVTRHGFGTRNLGGGPGPVGDRLVLGAGGLAAWPDGPDRWRVAPDDATIAVAAGESVLAVHSVADTPALVTVSAAGLVLRLRWPGAQRTLTAWSGGTEIPAAHPTRPWVAVRDDRDDIVVGDVAAGTELLRLAGRP